VRNPPSPWLLHMFLDTSTSVSGAAAVAAPRSGGDICIRLRHPSPFLIRGTLGSSRPSNSSCHLRECMCTQSHGVYRLCSRLTLWCQQSGRQRRGSRSQIRESALRSPRFRPCRPPDALRCAVSTTLRKEKHRQITRDIAICPKIHKIRGAGNEPELVCTRTGADAPRPVCTTFRLPLIASLTWPTSRLSSSNASEPLQNFGMSLFTILRTLYPPVFALFLRRCRRRLVKSRIRRTCTQVLRIICLSALCHLRASPCDALMIFGHKVSITPWDLL
jgi:hypothetical protein